MGQKYLKRGTCYSSGEKWSGLKSPVPLYHEV
jgi:hypothetical protein